MKYLFNALFLLATSLLILHPAAAQFDPDPEGNVNLSTITTAVPILTIGSDSRAAGMGDAGVATSPDANASYWNPAKLGFVQNDMAVSLSYSPWLQTIINDMSLSYLTGYKKVNERAAFSASLLYFDLGSIQFTDLGGNDIGQFNPKEYTVNVAYGQQLTENFGVGVGARFIHSNLASGIADTKPGNSGAVDIGVYYSKDLTIAAKDYNLSWGANISNIGAKISYTNADRKDFLPTNLRLGTAFTSNFDAYNKLTLAIDANKLLVPSSSEDFDKGVAAGIFTSFGDASFREEIREIILSTGLEYWYNDLFAARVGYFYESPQKGNRHYLSLGLGLRYQKFGIDTAYLAPNAQSNPLADTFRFTLSFNLADSETGGTR